MVSNDQWQFDQVAHTEKIKGKSLTLPGQSFTVEELMTRYGGVPIGVAQVRDFVDEDQDFDDPDVSKIPHMDITERHIAMQENAYRIQELEQSLEREAKEEADKQAAIAQQDAERQEKDARAKADEK